MHAHAQQVDASQPAWWVGYWQSEEHAAEVREVLREWFHVEYATGEDVIRIHVRRGDYVFSRQTLDPSWYARAAAAARSAFPNLAVQIYSDDVPWCRENLGSFADAFIEGGTPEDDLSALSQAAVLVASPSTFSWWAGYLGGMPVLSPATTKSPLWDRLPGMRVR
ncbi:MAG: alpha-1,2-fucosyltransferase [Candidatus Nanopelagicales bacterium]